MFGFSEIDAQDRCFTSSVAAVHLRLHIPLPSVFCISPKISSCNQLFKTSWHYMNQSFILQKLRQSLYMYHKLLMLSYFSPIQGSILTCTYLWNSKWVIYENSYIFLLESYIWRALSIISDFHQLLKSSTFQILLSPWFYLLTTPILRENYWCFKDDRLSIPWMPPQCFVGTVDKVMFSFAGYVFFISSNRMSRATLKKLRKKR